MVTFRDGAREAVQGATCQLFNDPSFAYSAGLSLGFANLGVTFRPGSVSQILCDDPNGLPPLPPQAQGGQCPGVFYDVDVEWESNAGTQTGQVSVVGPIRGTSSVPTAPGLVQVGVDAKNALGDDFFWAAGATQEEFADSIAIVNITRQDGLPDDCGNVPPPPPPPFPPDGVPYVRPITYTNNEGDDITINAPITLFAPVVDIDGNWTIPFEIELPDVTIPGDFNFAPDVDINLYPQRPTGDRGTADDEDELIEAEDEAGEPNPPDERGEVIIGVIVRSVVPDEAIQTAIATTEGPAIYAPRLGTVKFAIAVGSIVSWTSDLPVKNINCYVPCPAPQGAVAVRVSPAPGVTCVYTPVRGQPLLPG